MKELIKITENEQGQKLVSARDLYLGLGLDKSNWKRWSVKNIIENDYFKENFDWSGFVIMTNGNETKDFAITLRFAQHICMMARTEKSHEYRDYLLECEKQALQITRKDKLRLQLFSGDDLLIAQAHNELVRLEVEEATAPLIEKIETDKPKVDAFDQYMNSDGTYTTRNACKMLELSEKKVFAWLRVKGLVFKNKTQPTALAIEKGYFKVIIKHGYPTMTISPLGIEYIRTHYEED